LEYTYRQKNQFSETSIFWIQASTVARFQESYKQIATQFQLPGRDDPKVDVLQLVRNWLEKQYRKTWLMIIDNVDDTQIFGQLQNRKSLLEYM